MTTSIGEQSMLPSSGAGLRDRFRGRAPFIQINKSVVAWTAVITVDDVRLSIGGGLRLHDGDDVTGLETELDALLHGNAVAARARESE